jgi:hypothetical protein
MCITLARKSGLELDLWLLKDFPKTMWGSYEINKGTL